MIGSPRFRACASLLLALTSLPVTHAAWAAWPSDPTLNVPLSTAANDQQAPLVVSDGAGGAIVVWTDLRSGSEDIYAQRISASGVPQWTPNGVAVCTALGDQNAPSVIVDGAGGAIIAWQDFRTDVDVYAQRLNAAGVPQWAANGEPVGVMPGGQTSPNVVSDGAGGAIITWDDTRSGRYDIYAQRLNAAGAPQWAAGGVAVCSAAGDQYGSTSAADGAGGAFVGWIDTRATNGNPDVYIQRISGAGAILWAPSTGVPVCLAPNEQFVPRMIRDAGGGAMLSWNESRSLANSDVYVQRSDAGSGDPAFLINGLAACIAGGEQPDVAMLADGSGGVFLTWEDRRGGVPNSDIYWQHVSADGTPLWAHNGIAVCAAVNRQLSPAIVSDGSGGAIVTWVDQRASTSTTDIYAQRLDANGAPQWGVDGTPVCTAPDFQFSPTLVTAGAGQAIVAWSDLRNGDFDIYAQLVPLGGATGVQPMDPPRTISLQPAVPNPAPDGETRIGFSLAREGRVVLAIYDQQGRRVRTLVESVLAAGEHRVDWDGRDDSGRPVRSSLYFYRLEFDGRRMGGRVIAIR